MVYQETYHAPTYARHHLRGNKRDIAWRLATPDRLGRAGIDKIGLGHSSASPQTGAPTATLSPST